ncbi:MAG TPA: ribosomal-processing cysteine protease Prp [Candidatus Faecimonas gallistercoris]|nr:ribosomal-processing cysteine protease Prp [Candidatus Faecimonas gallistercoris]
MIQVKVEKAHAKYKKITILGHALYDEYGKDIVCSAASSIVTTTVNGVLALDKGSLSYMISKKGMTINIKNEDATTQILIGNMVSLLKELGKNYPANIEVK